MSTQLKVWIKEGVYDLFNVIYFILVDDVFVRKDLYEGKYAPDMQAWKKFDDIMKLPRQPSEEEVKTRNEETKMISEKEEL